MNRNFAITTKYHTTTSSSKKEKEKEKEKKKEKKSFFSYLHRDYFIIQVEVRSRFRHYSFLMMYTWNNFN